MPVTLKRSAAAFLLFITACATPPSQPPETGPSLEPDTRPNIILFLFDDAGYSDFSTFGGEIDTPTITALAQTGMVLSRFYTTARCSPTRAGILTGHHPHSVGMADIANGPQYHTPYPAYRGQLPLDVPLVSELLKASGYYTLLQGKWHLGPLPTATGDESDPVAPNARGFDEFVGLLGAQSQPIPAPGAKHPYQHNQQALVLEPGWFAIDGLNRLTLSLLDAAPRDVRRPFFLYVASQAPHLPLAARDGLVKKYETIYQDDPEILWRARVDGLLQRGLLPAGVPLRERGFSARQRIRIDQVAARRAAMIESADRALGEIIEHLRRRGELDNTLIIVASDNGAASESAALANAPFRGAKGNLWEGGLLSPMVITWPERLDHHQQPLSTPVSYLDIMPTLLEVAGIPYPTQSVGGRPLEPLPGTSLLSLLQGETRATMPDLYWNLYGRFAVLREGRWKLLANDYDADAERRGQHPPLKLFDLATDPAETENLADRYPERVASLLSAYETWASEHDAIAYYKVREAYRQNRERRRALDQQRLEEILRQGAIDQAQ